jgi:hypothetical protein
VPGKRYADPQKRYVIFLVVSDLDKSWCKRSIHPARELVQRQWYEQSSRVTGYSGNRRLFAIAVTEERDPRHKTLNNVSMKSCFQCFRYERCVSGVHQIYRYRSSSNVIGCDQRDGPHGAVGHSDSGSRENRQERACDAQQFRIRSTDVEGLLRGVSRSDRRWGRSSGCHSGVTSSGLIVAGEAKQRKISGRPFCIRAAVWHRWPSAWHFRHAILGAVVPFTH